MKLMRVLLTEVYGLFVDDGNLAILSLGLIGAITALVKLLSAPALLAAVLLLLGCLTILGLSVYRATRDR